LAQHIVKWTDANGQVHYSDHAPENQSTVAVSIPKAPRTVAPAAAPAAAGPVVADPFAARNAEISAMLEREHEEARKRDEARQRQLREIAAKKRQDDERIARCNANRETYCNDGVAGIERGERERQERIEKAVRAAETRQWLTKGYVEKNPR
jgi:hypothetical protein